MAAIILAILAPLAAFFAGRYWDATFRGKRQEPRKSGRAGGKRTSASKLIALGVLLVDGCCTGVVLYLCYLSIKLQYAGSLPYLTTLIGALQAVTGVVLTAYFNKAKAENTKGGIVYDAAIGQTNDTGDL